MRSAEDYDDKFTNRHIDDSYWYEKSLPVNNIEGCKVENLPSILQYIDDNKMRSDDLDVEVECLIENFIIKGALHMLFAPAGSGKTFLGVGISLRLINDNKVDKVIYIDRDNSMPVLKSRGLKKIVEKYDNFKLITRNKGEMSGVELLTQLVDACKKDNGIYDGYVFVFDSLRDFIPTKKNMNSDQDMMPILTMFKDIRDKGHGTVIFLHHTNRGEGTFKGSGAILDLVDEGYSVTSSRTQTGLSFELKAQKKRLLETNVAFHLNTVGDEMELITEDIEKKQMKQVELVVVEQAEDILLKNPEGLSQSALLKAMGKKETDPTAIKYLKEYINRRWKAKRVPSMKNAMMYYPLYEEDIETLKTS